MTNQILESSFPATSQDLTNLKQTGTDAAQDIASTAGVHAAKVKSNLKDLASHAREESREQLDHVKVRANDVGQTFCDFVAERPLASIATALALGYLLGLSRGGFSKNA